MLNMNTLDDITKEGLFCDGDWIEKKTKMKMEKFV